METGSDYCGSCRCKFFAKSRLSSHRVRFRCCELNKTSFGEDSESPVTRNVWVDPVTAGKRIFWIQNLIWVTNTILDKVLY